MSVMWHVASPAQMHARRNRAMQQVRRSRGATVFRVGGRRVLALFERYSAAGAVVIVEPPYEARQRAWERAYVLRQEFDEFLSLEQRIRAEVAIQTGPGQLGWNEIADMVALYSVIAGTRV